MGRVMEKAQKRGTKKGELLCVRKKRLNMKDGAAGCKLTTHDSEPLQAALLFFVASKVFDGPSLSRSWWL